MRPPDSSLGRTHGYWEYSSDIGVFRIVPYYGHYQVLLNDEVLGTYATPRRALDAAVRGTFSVDATGVGLPKELRAWIFMHSNRRNP